MEEFDQINHSFRYNYLAVEPFARHFDIEDKQKDDLAVKASSSYFHKDITNIQVLYEKIKAVQWRTLTRKI